MIRVPAVLAVLSSLVFGTGAMFQEFQSPVDVSFLAELDGTEQRYVILLPTGFDPDVPHDVMIALHGHGSDRWQFVNDKRPECQGARDTAR